MKLMPWKKKDNAVARGGEGASAHGLFRSEMNRLMDRFFTNPWTLFDEDPFLSASGWRGKLTSRRPESASPRSPWISPLGW